MVQKFGTRVDEHAPKHDSPEYAPKKHTILRRLEDAKMAKDDQEHEQVVNRERLFDEIGSYVSNTARRTEPVGDPDTQCQAKTDPQTASHECLPKTYDSAIV